MGKVMSQLGGKDADDDDDDEEIESKHWQMDRPTIALRSEDSETNRESITNSLPGS